MKRQTPEPAKSARPSWRRSRARAGSVLLIDVSGNQLTFAELTPGLNAIPIGSPRLCELPRDWSEAGREEETARWLAAQIAQHGFRARRAILLISRSMASFRTLESPSLPDDQLIPLLELQAETQSLTPFAELRWTFVRNSRSSADSTLHPLLITAPRRRLDPLLRMVELAGLEVEAVMPRSIALAAANADSSFDRPPAATDLWIIAETPEETEILLTDAKGQLTASQSVGHNSDHWVGDASESIRRWANAVAAKWNQCAAAQPNADRIRATSVCRFCVAPSHERALLEAMESVAGLGPTTLTSVAQGAADAVETESGSSRPSLAAFHLAALGLSSLVASGGWLPDLAHPPQVAPPRPRRWRLAAGLAGALLIAAGWSLQAAKARLDRQIQNLRQEEKLLSQWIDRGESVEALSAQLDQWSARQIDAREELSEFLSRLPENGDVTLSEVALSSLSDGRAQLRARGASTSAEVALKLNERMLAAPARYELQPHPLRKSRRNDSFSVAFEIEAEVRTANPQADDAHDDGHGPPPESSATR